jgi:hypothetical protein
MVKNLGLQVTAVRKLWRFVRPGGKLAITSWGRNVLEPANSVFWRSVSELRSESYKPSEPWDRIADPANLRRMLREGGVEADEVIAENRWHPIRSPEDWWTIVLGSGRRRAIEQLTPTQVTAIRETNLAFVRDWRRPLSGLSRPRNRTEAVERRWRCHPT